jgi:cytochrome c-type biogenesis protein
VIGTLGLSFLAGLLTVLSPCVLPVLPLVLGTATSEHRFGPLALAAGLALSFTAIGLFVATIGFAIGIDESVFRAASAVLMITVGLVLMSPRMQERLAVAGGPIGNLAEQRFGGFSTSGLTGQFLVGALLGAVWSPCVGPTLGAASVLASQGEDLGRVTLTMLVFGLGSALPLAMLGFLTRETLIRWRGRMLGAGKNIKVIFGALLAAIGILVLFGLDKRIEAFLVSVSPEWLTTLTTRF